MTDPAPGPRPESAAQPPSPERADNGAPTVAAAAIPGGTEPTGPLPAGVVFGLFAEEFRLAVVGTALRARKSAGPPLRKPLDGRLRKLRVPGFRDASRAPPGQLAIPVLDAIQYGDDHLAGAVLNLWATADAPLRDAAVRELDNAGIPSGGEIAGGRFAGPWPFGDWLERRDALAAALPDVAPDAAGLMLAVAANRLPEPPFLPDVSSPRFQNWFDELDALAPDAPEWQDATDFALSLLVLADLKSEERRQAALAARDAAVKRVAHEYVDELRYLGIELAPWLADDARDPALTASLADELAATLARYRPVHPRGATRAEETERAPHRTRLEDAILDVPPRWEALPRESAPDDTGAGAPDEGGPAHPTARELAEAQRAQRQAAAECDRLRAAAADLESGHARLAETNATLRLAKEQLDAENSRLRGDLDRARATEEHWRGAYVDARRARAAADGGAAEIDSVAGAVELAARAFPDVLAVALNGKSDPAVPFAKPAEVFDALAWLATAYRRRGAPGIGESCPGWFHKPDQSEATVGMYPDWYRTSFEGRAVAVTSHIGKGASFDPRSTIRIGFAWDDKTQRVVVGYVGRHQRNRHS